MEAVAREARRVMWAAFWEAIQEGREFAQVGRNLSPVGYWFFDVISQLEGE